MYFDLQTLSFRFSKREQFLNLGDQNLNISFPCASLFIVRTKLPKLFPCQPENKKVTFLLFSVESKQPISKAFQNFTNQALDESRI